MLTSKSSMLEVATPVGGYVGPGHGCGAAVAATRLLQNEVADVPGGEESYGVQKYPTTKISTSSAVPAT
jgi:hypothetical protein